MTRTRILTGLVLLLMSLPGTAMRARSASTQELPPNITAAPADSPPIRKPGKMDVRHPLHIGSDYYPKESLKKHEQGRCSLAFYTQADGTVSAAQLLKSTGFRRLDTACLESVIGVPVIPPTINGTPVAGWSDFNLVWVIDHPQPYQAPPERSAFPRAADDYEFQVGPKFYPESAPVQNPKGYCVVHTTVGSTGTALNASITRSTGSAILDKACLSAVTTARFTPELQDGKPVPDSTDIAIYW